MKASQLLTYMIAGLIAMSILCALISFACGYFCGQLVELKKAIRFERERIDKMEFAKIRLKYQQANPPVKLSVIEEKEGK